MMAALTYIALAGLGMVLNRTLQLSDGGIFFLILCAWAGLLWAGVLG
jgi:hypothetical protein